MMVYQGKPGFRASLRLFFRCFSYVQHKGIFVIGFVMASTEYLIAFATPILYQIIMTVISDSSKAGQAQTKLPLLLAGITLLIPVCTYGRYLQIKCSAQGSAELNKAMFDHIQRMPVTTVSKNGMDVYLTRLNMDADAAANVFGSYGLTAFAKFIVIGGGSLIALMLYSWQMALLGLCVGVCCAFFALLWTPKLRQMEWDAKEANSLSLSSLIGILQGLRIVQVFNLKEILQKKYNMICEVIYDKRVKFCTFRGIMYGLLDVCSYIAQPLAMLIGIWVLVDKGIDITRVILISSYVALVGTAMLHFTNFALHLPKSLVAAQRVFNIMDQEIETQIEDSNTVDLFCLNSITFSNLCFSYLPKQPVLEDISFFIKKGEHVAIIGESGCGKSTLMKLIQRLIEPDSGDIAAFSASYWKTSLETTRSLISYIPQECNLFFGTIADNIAFGKEKATMAEIIEAARKANIHQFVESLPQGYNTLVGERGYALSGGQRQRIVIARALIKDAPILLMDEPTSSLDIENEDVIFKEVLSTAKDKTIIAITHRMSIAEHMDRIFLIENRGCIEINKTFKEIV